MCNLGNCLKRCNRLHDNNMSQFPNIYRFSFMKLYREHRLPWNKSIYPGFGYIPEKYRTRLCGTGIRTGQKSWIWSCFIAFLIIKWNYRIIFSFRLSIQISKEESILKKICRYTSYLSKKCIQILFRNN